MILRYVERAAAYGVGTTRVETGRGPLDLILFFRRDRATFEQVRDKVGDCGSLSLQQSKAGFRVRNNSRTDPEKQVQEERRTIWSSTNSYDLSVRSNSDCRHSRAILWKPPPGNHSGM